MPLKDLHASRNKIANTIANLEGVIKLEDGLAGKYIYHFNLTHILYPATPSGAEGDRKGFGRKIQNKCLG